MNKMLLIGAGMLLVLGVAIFVVVVHNTGFWRTLFSFGCAIALIAYLVVAAWFLRKGGI